LAVHGQNLRDDGVCVALGSAKTPVAPHGLLADYERLLPWNADLDASNLAEKAA